MALLEVKNLNTGYGKKQVLKNVSLKVESGDIVLLIGSNGSGKSTLLKAIYGLLPVWPSENVSREPLGNVYFDGEVITGCRPSKLLEKGLLYIPQNNNLFADLTVKENLEMAGLTIRGSRLLKVRISKALETFPLLAPLLHRTPMKLSGGERQQLVLAMACLHNPKMILFDEPFSGLDPSSMQSVLDMISALNYHYGVTMLIVEHRFEPLLTRATVGIVMRLGAIVASRQFTANTNDPGTYNWILTAML